jgi:alpha-1,2-mannosyltransferase
MLDFLKSADAAVKLSLVPIVIFVALVGYPMRFPVFVPTEPGVATNRFGNAVGHDFAEIWLAGRATIDGHVAGIYDPRHRAEFGRTYLGRAEETLGWRYPPTFLFLSVPSALLPLPIAALIWVVGTTGALVFLLHRILPYRRTIAVAIGAPVLISNFGYGQNGAFTALLLGSALLALREGRSLAAAVGFGLIAYKPSLGLPIPFALAGGGRFRVFILTGCVVLLPASASLVVFGPEVWLAFLDNIGTSGEVLVVGSGPGIRHYASVRGAADLAGLPSTFALALQAVVTAAVLFTLFRVWRSDASFEIKAAMLCGAVPLSFPYLLVYDLAVLCPAAAFFVADGLKRGFRTGEVFGLALVWVLPSFRLPAASVMIPAASLAAILFYVMAYRRFSWSMPSASRSFPPEAPSLPSV